MDSSAVLAVLRLENDAARFVHALVRAERRAISAANWFGASILVDSRGTSAARADFDTFFERHRIEVVSVTPDQARRARAAYAAFGKGNHPASLNFGDCFAYALAQERDQPLLFKGDDFARTDVKPAI